jgi:hypothetical protein
MEAVAIKLIEITPRSGKCATILLLLIASSKADTWWR